MWHLTANIPDPIRKHFGYGQLCPLRPACSQNRVGLYMPDPTSRIRFFQRRPGSYCAKSARIRSGWPAQLRKQAVCKNHRAGFRQSATGVLPISHFQPLLCSSTDDPNHAVRNKPWSDLVLAKRIRSGGTPVGWNNLALFWPTLSSRSLSYTNRIRLELYELER